MISQTDVKKDFQTRYSDLNPHYPETQLQSEVPQRDLYKTRQSFDSSVMLLFSFIILSQFSSLFSKFAFQNSPTGNTFSLSAVHTLGSS